MRRATFVYVTAMLTLAVALSIILTPWYTNRPPEAFVMGYLTSIAVQWWTGVALWKKLRRLFA